MAKASKPHWGQWIEARSRFIGVRRKQDLADSIGCTPQHLAAWIRMATPPKSMRKGFDATLARALQTTKVMLFSDWHKNPPETVPVFAIHGDHYFPDPNAATDEVAEVYRLFPPEMALSKIVAKMTEPERWDLVRQAAAIVIAKNDDRRGVVEAIVSNWAGRDVVEFARQPHGKSRHTEQRDEARMLAEQGIKPITLHPARRKNPNTHS